MAREPPAPRARGITKRFPGVLRTTASTSTYARGEVHALLGENGAGKSTLMNDPLRPIPGRLGEILFDGEPVTIDSPRDAIDAGIGMVHQHFMLIPVMTVAENIVLGIEPTQRCPARPRRRPRRRARARATSSARRRPARAGRVDLGRPAAARRDPQGALPRAPRSSILDEPTAVLTPQEATSSSAILRALKEQGRSIIFITHKLDEVLEIADRITVMRRGKTIDTCRAEARPSRPRAR